MQPVEPPNLTGLVMGFLTSYWQDKVGLKGDRLATLMQEAAKRIASGESLQNILKAYLEEPAFLEHLKTTSGSDLTALHGIYTAVSAQPVPTPITGRTAAETAKGPQGVAQGPTAPGPQRLAINTFVNSLNIPEVQAALKRGMDIMEIFTRLTPEQLLAGLSAGKYSLADARQLADLHSFLTGKTTQITEGQFGGFGGGGVTFDYGKFQQDLTALEQSGQGFAIDLAGITDSRTAAAILVSLQQFLGRAFKIPSIPGFQIVMDAEGNASVTPLGEMFDETGAPKPMSPEQQSARDQLQVMLATLAARKATAKEMMAVVAKMHTDLAAQETFKAQLISPDIDSAAEAAIRVNQIELKLGEQRLALEKFNLVLTMLSNPLAMAMIRRNPQFAAQLKDFVGIDFSAFLGGESPNAQAVLAAVRQAFGDVRRARELSKSDPQVFQALLAEIALKHGLAIPEIVQIIMQAAEQETPGEGARPPRFVTRGE